MKWLPLIAICLVLSLIVRTEELLAQTLIAAPTINSVTPGDGRLTIGWSAPAGVTGITAYDLHYIETSADETVDSNWTKVEDVWTGSGDLEYGLGGLDNGVGYDVQMRTVTTTDGAWSGTSNGTPQITGPAITSVITGDGALTVVWTAPAVAATTAIDAYDLRYIETSADETVDGNWTVLEEFWISGSLHGVLAGLTNGTSYDVQVRAASDTDGAWSSTSTGTPAEHGNSIGAATTITLGTPLGGAIDPGTDEDYFKLVLSKCLLPFWSGPPATSIPLESCWTAEGASWTVTTTVVSRRNRGTLSFGEPRGPEPTTSRFPAVRRLRVSISLT